MVARTLVLSAVLLSLPGADTLATDYGRDRSVRVSIESSVSLDTTSQRIERDGQPVEARSGMSTAMRRALEWTDKVAERAEGAPSKVVRSFGDLVQTSSFTFGDQEQSRDQDGALSNVVLELTRGEDGVEAKALEGDAPSESLEGHRLELFLDALLPEGDEDEWELDNAEIRRVLVFDLQGALFPPQEPSSEEGGGRRGRGSMGRIGASTLAAIEWEGKAKLSDATEEHDGATCKVIELQLEGKATIEDPAPGGGRAFGVSSAALPESKVESKLEGRMLFDTAKRLPVRLELRGDVKIESKREGDWGGTPFKSESTMEGELLLEATVAEVED